MSRALKVKRVLLVVFGTLASATLMILFGTMILNAVYIREGDMRNIYYTAHSTSDIDVFNHLMNTAAGNTLVDGTLTFKDPVTHPMISGNWGMIEVEVQRYYRVRRYIRDEDGNVTGFYYVSEWRHVSRRHYHSTEYLFMGQIFRRTYDMTIFSGSRSIDHREYAVDPARVTRTHIYSTPSIREGTTRTQFHVRPPELFGAAFVDFRPTGIYSPEHHRDAIIFRANHTKEDLFERGTRSNFTAIMVLWIIFSLGVVTIVVILKYNIWLRDICLEDICPSNIIKFLRRKRK